MSNQVEKLKDNWQKYGKFYPTVIDKVKSIFRYQEVKQPDGTIAYWTAAGQIPTLDKKLFVNEGWSKNVIVYSVISKIAQTAAQAEFGAYKIINDKAYKDYKNVCGTAHYKEKFFDLRLLRSKALELLPDTHDLNKLLKYPNEQQGQASFIENYLGMEMITGDGYMWASLNGRKQPIELFVLPSQYMTIVPTNTFPMRESAYQLSFGGKIIPLTKEEVMHTKYWNPHWNVDGLHLYGFSPLHAGWLSIQQDNDAKKAGIEILQNRGPRGLVGWDVSGIPNADFNKAKEQTGRLKEAWEQTKKEYKDDLAIMIGKVNWVQTGLSMTDLQILDVSKYTQVDICNLYGVSAKLFNAADDAKFSNLQEYRKDLISNVALPKLDKLRDSLNRKLMTDWGYKGQNIIVDFDATVFKELDEDKTALSQWMTQAACFTENEKRIALGYDAVEYAPDNANLMDKIYKPSNQLPLEKLGIIAPSTFNNQQNEESGTDRKN